MRFLPLLVCLCGLVRADTVVVIPFANHSGSANLSWIGESVAETVNDALASEGLLALDRGDRMEGYRRLSLRPGAELTHASIIKIADALDASSVIYGYYELLPADDAPQSKGSLRLTARIIDMKRSTQSAPFSEVGALEDLALLEARLGWQALHTLAPKSAPPQEDFLKARPAVRLDAMESYVRGLLSTAPEQQHRFFTQAARLDQNYSPPCYQLGKAAWEQKEYKTAAGWLERVARSDAHYLESRFYLGLCRYYLGDFQSAETALGEVSAAMPLNEVFNDLGAAQSRRGQYASAIASFRKALEGDDADPDFYFNLGYAQWRLGMFDAAVESFRASVQRSPDDAEATSLLGYALKKTAPRTGDPRTEGRQRIKTNYDEAAYRQLQAELKK
jgi:tetratricopeptide (TPR) repeat protein